MNKMKSNPPRRLSRTRVKYFVLATDPGFVYRLRGKKHNLEFFVSVGWATSCTNKLTNLKRIPKATALQLINKIHC